MARAKIKIEMKGTGGGRWCWRSEAKEASKQRRRQIDREEADERLAEVEPADSQIAPLSPYQGAEVDDDEASQGVRSQELEQRMAGTPGMRPGD